MSSGIYRGDLLEFKVIISDGGKTYQKEIKDEEAARLVGLRIGEVFDGKLIGESGRLQITGGTDKDGFPMRRGIPGSRRMKILVRGGPGFIPKKAGERRKKRVRGDTINEDIVQINTKVAKEVKKVKKKVEAKEVKAKPEIAEEAEEVKEAEEAEVKEVKKKVEKKEKVEKEAKKVKKKKVKKVKEEKPEEKVEKIEKVEKVEKKVEEAKEKAIPVIKVRGIGKKTADLLATAGITSVTEFLESDTTKLAKKTGLSTSKLEKMKEDAQELVG